MPRLLTARIVLADSLGSAHGDPDQFQTALLNIAINARDAMPGGGRLTIATSNRRRYECPAGSRAARPGEYVEIAVSDTGCGMPPEVSRRACEPFFTTKEVGKGTGLGLAQVERYAKQSGGYVSIESVEGRGTTVRISLPRASKIGEIVGQRGSEGGAPRLGLGEPVRRAGRGRVVEAELSLG